MIKEGGGISEIIACVALWCAGPSCLRWLFPLDRGLRPAQRCGAPLRAGRRTFLPACGLLLAAGNSWDRNPFLRIVRRTWSTILRGESEGQQSHQ